MSIPVAVAELVERVREYGTVAYLVTTGDDSRPHVVSVRVGWRDAELVVGAGNRTQANVGARPDVTLLWPALPGSGYSLIVDGTATVEAGDGQAQLAIAPGKAVLHRTPEGDPNSPSCVTVLAAD